MPKLDPTKHPYPLWPRGTYNGQRIVGIDLGFTLWVDNWWWRPRWYRWSGILCWLCFRVVVEFEYRRD